MKLPFITFAFLFFMWGCALDSSAEQENVIETGQSQMAGEVTERSAIVQARLTEASKKSDKYGEGVEGVGCFEISTSSEFKNSYRTPWQKAEKDNDYILRAQVGGLQAGTEYFWQVLYGKDKGEIRPGRVCRFRTLEGKEGRSKVSFVVVTGMNYARFHLGKNSYKGEDKKLGYPVLETILKMKPDFFVGTGDNVYYDHPAGEQAAKTPSQIRKKYHEQFGQQRYIELFAQVPTYWEKDDHDYRYNDCDNSGEIEPLPALGRKMFREQLPVVEMTDEEGVTYRTHRINQDLQVWLVEVRDYRSANSMPDGAGKSIWGKEQKSWLKETLSKSDATFKILISPTPMIGPDDGYKKDNHTNIGGFRYERDEFFRWLKDNGFDKKGFYIVCGDRHWQYHSIDVSGFEEFSCGALVDANSRIGRKPGDPKSTDPEGTIKQAYCMQKASGGFLLITVEPGENDAYPKAHFDFFDEKGELLYSHTKQGKWK
jgi:alkaline phosphatase/alkaline phosphatase D